MKQRTKNMRSASGAAKVRDDHLCCICKQGPIHGVVIHGAHLLVRNAGYPRYNPADIRFFITLCARHHRLYDANHRPEDKAAWLRREAALLRKHKDKPGTAEAAGVIEKAAGMIDYAIGNRKTPTIPEAA